MRRFLFVAMAFVMIVQGSGAAVAAPTSSAHYQRSLLAEVKFDLGEIVAAVQTTQVGSILTGQGQRWVLMHAPAPARVPMNGNSNPRATILRDLVRPRSIGEGLRLQGPAMLAHPLTHEEAMKIHAPSLTPAGQPRRGAFAINTFVPRVPAGGVTNQRATQGRVRALTVTVGSSNPTGINHWWAYEEAPIPGVGTYMVNVSNGNAIVQSTDVDIPERGINLTFRRTYNSLSLNDWNSSGANDDGSPAPNIYGAGWTNTFGAHLALNSSGGLSVFDIDGARYDYTPGSNGCFTPPSGMFDALCSDGNGGGYFWYKKNGAIYYFYNPSDSGSIAGYAGRLYRIYARNQNNYIQLNYSWANGDSSTTVNLTQIVVQHSDGQSLTLAFGTVNGWKLLSSITRPDSSQVSYLYPNPSGNNNNSDLEEVDLPGNNQGTIRQQYGYWSSTNQLNWVSSPLWFMTGAAQGAYTWFNYDSSSRLDGVQLYGFDNFTPSDGTSTALQSSYGTSYHQMHYSTYTYQSSTQTDFSDTDGHATDWTFDSSGRVTQTQDWTGSVWLVTSASWDTNNDLTESVDARNYATDYAYDTNGNTTAVALPSVTLNNGTYRPTSLYSYDRTNGANNTVEYCDPVETNALGQNWTGNPGTSDSLCPNQGGTTRYTWDYTDGAEPYGRLSNSYTPLGYHRAYSYSTSAQGGDYSLPSDVTGDSMTQADGTNRQPHLTFSYDGYGNLTGYGTGSGTWNLSYDSLNRLTSATDPDSVTTRKCYYANGQLQVVQTASQYAADGNVACGSHSVSYSYDDDGNLTSETHHYGSVGGTTTKYYDGADRLVEVQQPQDPNGHDLFNYAWMTRYLYDLSQDSTVSEDGATFHAYGNLFKTQEYAPSTPVVPVNSAPASPAWLDVRGSSYDAMDRPLAVYENSFGTTAKTSYTYDGSSSTYGLLSQSQNATGGQMLPSYFATGWLLERQYQNDGGVTPNLTYTYDADGRQTSINSSTFGTETRSYDSDDRLTSDADPTGGGYSSPATTTYSFYADGLKEYLSVSSSAVSSTDAFQYSYRTDGLIQKEHLIYPITGDFAWTYTNAGRDLTQSDPYTGDSITLYTLLGNATSSHRTLQAKTFTYDSYGRVASLVLPQGYTYGSFTYDTEDQTTGYSKTNAYCPTNTLARSCNPGNRTQTYDVRGELVAVSDTNQFAGYGGLSANGVLVTSNGSGGSYDSFDARNGMVVNKYLRHFSWNVPYAYDADGRQTQVTDTYPYGNSTAYATRAYDTENHIISQAYTNTSFSCNMDLEMCGGVPNGNVSTVSTGTTNTYAWGPNGHPIKVVAAETGTGQDTASIHWDGDDILFGVNQSSFMDFEVGKLGSANYTGTQFAQGFHVSDRDMTGQVVSTHSWQEFGSWDGAPPAKQCGTCSKGPASGFTTPSSTSNNPQNFASTISYLSGVREDGYSDGYGNTFQGVRAYDGNLETWTTPDAYAGEVHDPMSQKPFIWNHDNPIAYEDPSGYLSFDDVYNFLIGSDINTLKSPTASPVEKIIAGASIASNLIAPEEKAAALAGKAAKVGIERAFESGAAHDLLKTVDDFLGEGAHTVTRGTGTSDIRIAGMKDASGGYRQVRADISKLNEGQSPHLNLEYYRPKEGQPGRFQRVVNVHAYLKKDKPE